MCRLWWREFQVAQHLCNSHPNSRPMSRSIAQSRPSLAMDLTPAALFWHVCLYIVPRSHMWYRTQQNFFFSLKQTTSVCTVYSINNKMTISFRMCTNKMVMTDVDTTAAYFAGLWAQVSWLGPNVTSHLALLCIHQMIRLNFQNSCAILWAA